MKQLAPEDATFIDEFTNANLNLGGKITYKEKVDKILIENNRATGVRFIDGTNQMADYIISAAAYSKNSAEFPYEQDIARPGKLLHGWTMGYAGRRITKWSLNWQMGNTDDLQKR